MKRFLLLLMPFVLLGVGCASSPTVSSTVDIPMAETMAETSAPTTLYLMSNNLLIFSAPSDWRVVQRDGGGVSVIEVESTLGAQMVISVEIAETFDGEPIVYQDWLAEDFDFSDAGSTTQINGNTFDVHEIVSEGQESRRIFTAEIQGEDRKYFVEITLPIVSGGELQSVIDSFVFNPSAETRATAQVIR